MKRWRGWDKNDVTFHRRHLETANEWMWSGSKERIGPYSTSLLHRYHIVFSTSSEIQVGKRGRWLWRIYCWNISRRTIVTTWRRWFRFSIAIVEWCTKVKCGFKASMLCDRRTKKISPDLKPKPLFSNIVQWPTMTAFVFYWKLTIIDGLMWPMFSIRRKSQRKWSNTSFIQLNLDLSQLECIFRTRGKKKFPRLKAGSYEINDCLSVCLFVTGSKEHYRQGYLVWGVTMRRGVVRCAELESEVRLPVKPIGRPETNGNRASRKQAFLRYLDAGNMNPRPNHGETTLVAQECCLRSITIQRKMSISGFWVYYNKHGFKYRMMYTSWNEVVFNSNLSLICMTKEKQSPRMYLEFVEIYVRKLLVQNIKLIFTGCKFTCLSFRNEPRDAQSYLPRSSEYMKKKYWQFRENHKLLNGDLYHPSDGQSSNMLMFDKKPTKSKLIEFSSRSEKVLRPDVPQYQMMTCLSFPEIEKTDTVHTKNWTCK